jgi:hypothetical protein
VKLNICCERLTVTKVSLCYPSSSVIAQLEFINSCENKTATAICNWRSLRVPVILFSCMPKKPLLASTELLHPVSASPSIGSSDLQKGDLSMGIGSSSIIASSSVSGSSSVDSSSELQESAG